MVSPSGLTDHIDKGGERRAEVDHALAEQMMMQAGIMIQDPRHTLPNLKTLLLTLASRDKPPVETDEVRTRGSG